MRQQVLENPINPTLFLYRELAQTIFEIVQLNGDKYGLKFAQSKNIGDLSFTVSSPTLRLEVTANLDGSIEYRWPDSTWPEGGRFEVIDGDSGLRLKRGNESFTLEEVRHEVLLPPFTSRPLNQSLD